MTTRRPGIYTTHRYNGTRIEVIDAATVKVFWPNCYLNPIYIAESMTLATRWVDAYLGGEKWAMDAHMSAKVG